MRYDFKHCKTVVEVEASIRDGPPETVPCPECGEPMARVYAPLVDIWHCQGAHKTDYGKNGDKLEALNKQWSKHFGEDPPPPAKDVPINSGDPF